MDKVVQKARSRLVNGLLLSVMLSTPCASIARADMACAGDALRFCSAEIPDQTRVKSCLLRNISGLTSECRAQFREGRGIRAARKHGTQ